MSLSRIPLSRKIMILSFGVVLFSLLIGGIILIGNIYNQREQELGERGLITGRIVANLPETEEYMKASKGWEQLNPVVDRIRTINRADYITVLDMNRIRYSHPVKSRLGTVSSGKDEGAAFAQHSYVSKAKGDSGVAVRSFVPIMDENQEQIGVVIVGNMMPSLFDILQSIRREILLTGLLTLLFGVIGSWMLARHIKKQTFQLEPHEIAGLLVERTAIFQAMNEGIIAVDREEKIVVFNDKAKMMLGIEKDVAGRSFHDVIKEPGVSEKLLNGPVLDHEMVRIGEKVVMATRVPITVEGERTGEVIVAVDRTEMARLAEELTGVKAFVDALRVQNHEHMNKLHTLAGLIQLDQKDKALDYVFSEAGRQEKLSGMLTKNIKDYSIAGLLLSKVSRGQELGISVRIDTHSRLLEYPRLLDRHDFVIMLGNLIENAFDALKGSGKKEKVIDISIEQDEEICSLSVEDNGKGMDEAEVKSIFKKGFTTKAEAGGSGIGLYLINKIVEKGAGEIEVESHPGEGTRFALTFPMEMEGKHDERQTGKNRRLVN
ncbi:ATP-binding protein [Bacillus marinisedimentorum]|uniref:ATP-binding protein n=1 Tax=Bacillus marinisedimentorum TaxID=1821260 RepID=UPI0007E1528D|nr:sensor histidine kinase [Bacillus marinisedimentorum]